jgi:hypothetical protein
MTLPAQEVIRRCLPHGLPQGVHTVRYDGLWSPVHRPLLHPLQRALAGHTPAPPPTAPARESHPPDCWCPPAAPGSPVRTAAKACSSWCAPSPDIPRDPHATHDLPVASPRPRDRGRRSSEPWLPGTTRSAAPYPSQGVRGITTLMVLGPPDPPTFPCPSSPRCTHLRLQGPCKSPRQAAQLILKSHPVKCSGAVQQRFGVGCAPQKLSFVRHQVCIK